MEDKRFQRRAPRGRLATFTLPNVAKNIEADAEKTLRGMRRVQALESSQRQTLVNALQVKGQQEIQGQREYAQDLKARREAVHEAIQRNQETQLENLKTKNKEKDELYKSIQDFSKTAANAIRTVGPVYIAERSAVISMQLANLKQADPDLVASNKSLEQTTADITAHAEAVEGTNPNLKLFLDYRRKLSFLDKILANNLYLQKAGKGFAQQLKTAEAQSQGGLWDKKVQIRSGAGKLIEASLADFEEGQPDLGPEEFDSLATKLLQERLDPLTGHGFSEASIGRHALPNMLEALEPHKARFYAQNRDALLADRQEQSYNNTIAIFNARDNTGPETVNLLGLKGTTGIARSKHLDQLANNISKGLKSSRITESRWDDQGLKMVEGPNGKMVPLNSEAFWGTRRYKQIQDALNDRIDQETRQSDKQDASAVERLKREVEGLIAAGAYDPPTQAKLQKWLASEVGGHETAKKLYSELYANNLVSDQDEKAQLARLVAMDSGTGSRVTPLQFSTFSDDIRNNKKWQELVRYHGDDLSAEDRRIKRQQQDNLIKTNAEQLLLSSGVKRHTAEWYAGLDMFKNSIKARLMTITESGETTWLDARQEAIELESKVLTIPIEKRTGMWKVSFAKDKEGKELNETGTNPQGLSNLTPSEPTDTSMIDDANNRIYNTHNMVETLTTPISDGGVLPEGPWLAANYKPGTIHSYFYTLQAQSKGRMDAAALQELALKNAGIESGSDKINYHAQQTMCRLNGGGLACEIYTREQYNTFMKKKEEGGEGGQEVIIDNATDYLEKHAFATTGIKSNDLAYTATNVATTKKDIYGQDVDFDHKISNPVKFSEIAGATMDKFTASDIVDVLQKGTMNEITAHGLDIAEIQFAIDNNIIKETDLMNDDTIQTLANWQLRSQTSKWVENFQGARQLLDMLDSKELYGHLLNGENVKHQIDFYNAVFGSEDGNPSIFHDAGINAKLFNSSVMNNLKEVIQRNPNLKTDWTFSEYHRQKEQIERDKHEIADQLRILNHPKNWYEGARMGSDFTANMRAVNPDSFEAGTERITVRGKEYDVPVDKFAEIGPMPELDLPKPSRATRVTDEQRQKAAASLEAQQDWILKVMNMAYEPFPLKAPEKQGKIIQVPTLTNQGRLGPRQDRALIKNEQGEWEYFK